MTVKNSKGKVWYGLHMYPGVAEYAEKGKEPFRIFINETTIREMNPTFAARPVFVRHADDVSEDLSKLKSDADGWVVESFFNQADGKTWCKFITVSERADRAIQSGWKLSNCYIPHKLGNGGTWNGLTYDREVVTGEYEHLAIVPDPRYEESLILSPEQFKEYNEKKVNELKRLSNNNERPKMKLKIFKREKVENSIDTSLVVVLPKSGKEMTIEQLVNAADESDTPRFANAKDKVKVGENEMTVSELVAEYTEACKELALKNKKDAVCNEDDEEMDDEVLENEDDEEMDEDEVLENEDDGDVEALKKAEELVDHEEEEIEDKIDRAKNRKKNSAAAREKADKLRNAHKNPDVPEVRPVMLPRDQLALGRKKYGS